MTSPHAVKIDQKALDELLEEAGDQCLEGLSLKHLRNVLKIQGYFSGITHSFKPLSGRDGGFSGWTKTPR